MIDSQGYRANVGIILCSQGKVFWGKRVNQDAWQFPQGGVNSEKETAEECLYRELHEEIGLQEEDVSIIKSTKHWLRYKLPRHMIRSGTEDNFIGQKQKWYLLKLKSDESKIDLKITESPEFDGWDWVSYWYPLRYVVNFKREVYRQALKELSYSFFNISPAKKVYLDCLYSSGHSKDKKIKNNAG